MTILFQTQQTFFSSLFSSGKNIAAILSGNFTGISNVSAEEIVYRSGLDSSLAAEACTLEEQTRLWNAFSGVMDLIRTQQFSPCIAYDNNEPKEFSAFLLTGLTEYRLQTLFEAYSSGSVQDLHLIPFSPPATKATGDTIINGKDTYYY